MHSFFFFNLFLAMLLSGKVFIGNKGLKNISIQGFENTKYLDISQSMVI